MSLGTMMCRGPGGHTGRGRRGLGVCRRARERSAQKDGPPGRWPSRPSKTSPNYSGAGQDPIKALTRLFLPEGAQGLPRRPLVHGGAWLHGDKNFLGFYSALGRSLAPAGHRVAVTNYRCRRPVKHPEHVKDVARAFAWAHKNIAATAGGLSPVPLRPFRRGHLCRCWSRTKPIFAARG